MYVHFLMSILHLINCVVFCQCHYFTFLTLFTYFSIQMGITDTLQILTFSLYILMVIINIVEPTIVCSGTDEDSKAEIDEVKYL